MCLCKIKWKNNVKLLCISIVMLNDISIGFFVKNALNGNWNAWIQNIKQKHKDLQYSVIFDIKTLFHILSNAN